LYLIAMLDDATSEATARFVDHDSTEENLGMLGSYVKTNGRPLAVYTDKASLFQTAAKGIHHRQAPAQQPTQIGRALKELGHFEEAIALYRRALQLEPESVDVIFGDPVA